MSHLQIAILAMYIAANVPVLTSPFRYIHGARVVFPPVMIESETAAFWMFDFNVHPKRINDPVPYPKSRFEIVDREVVIEPGDIFLHPVVSRLPHAVSTRGNIGDYSGFMIDQEQLIGLNVSA